MRYRIGGSITQIEPQALISALKNLFPDLKSRARIFGHDIDLVRDEFELFINSYNDSEFNIDIAFFKEEEKLLVFLTELKDALLTTNAIFDLWYAQTDDEGDQTGEDCEYFNSETSSS